VSVVTGGALYPDLCNPIIMADPALLTDSLIQNSFVRAIEDVFRTMAQHTIVFVERAQTVEAAQPDAVPQIIGNVGFVGKVNGLVYLGMPEAFGRKVACSMLGMDVSELMMSGTEALNDVIGEITNMTVGGFKNSLADVGFPCKLTVPTIVRGTGLSVRSIKTAHRYIFHFDCKGERVSVDIQMQIESSP
jgi:chemotaxis protein CheX